MLRTPHYEVTDPAFVRELVRDHPWATLFSATPEGLVASHYPILLEDPDSDDIVLRAHVGRNDDRLHHLGEVEMLVVVQGPHGYVSPSWYAEGDIVPTWDDVVVHLWGMPEILPHEENFATLRRLVHTFEDVLPDGRALEDDPQLSRDVARGTVGFRLPVTRWQARAKLSQNKPPEVRRRIADELDGTGPYAQPALAKWVRRVDPEQP